MLSDIQKKKKKKKKKRKKKRKDFKSKNKIKYCNVKELISADNIVVADHNLEEV